MTIVKSDPQKTFYVPKTSCLERTTATVNEMCLL